MDQLLAALLGAVIGSFGSYYFQHRLWLRNARMAAYLETVRALDAVHAAEASYVATLHVLGQVIAEGDVTKATRIRRLADQHWDEFGAAKERLKQAQVGVELLAPFMTKARFSLAGTRSTMLLMAHTRKAAEEIDDAIQSWDEEDDDRRQERRQIIETAKRELGIEQSPQDRMRRVRNRTLGRIVRGVLKVSRRASE